MAGAFPLAANNRSTTPMRTPASSSAIRSTSSIMVRQPQQRSRRPRQPAPSTIRKPITTRKPRPHPLPLPRTRWFSRSPFRAVPQTNALRSAPGRPVRCRLVLVLSKRIAASRILVNRLSTPWTQQIPTWSTFTTRTSSMKCSQKTIQAVITTEVKVEQGSIRAALGLVASITWPNPTVITTNKQLMQLNTYARALIRRWLTRAKSFPPCRHRVALTTATHYSSNSCSKGQL